MATKHLTAMVVISKLEKRWGTSGTKMAPWTNPRSSGEVSSMAHTMME